MSDVPVRNVQRRRGAPRFGDRHRIWRTGLLGQSTCLSAGGAIQGGCGAQIWGQTRNLQAGHGSRIWGQTRNLGDGTLTRGTCPSAGRAVPAGCGAQIWGQTRCPICRSGTFNVQRSTRNFQRGDRKGVLWPGYGDRHGIWADGLLTRWTWRSAGWVVQAGRGTQIWGQTRCSIYRSGTFNVKRLTLNF